MSTSPASYSRCYYDKMFLPLVPFLLALERIGLCLLWGTNYLLALPLVIFCHSPATSSHSHRSWCDGLGMGSPCNLVFNHQSATFSCAPRWWDIVVLLAGIAVRFVTHRDPRSPWRLPCRQLPTSLGWLRRGRSWEQEHKHLLSQSELLHYLLSELFWILTWGGCLHSPCWPWS